MTTTTMTDNFLTSNPTHIASLAGDMLYCDAATYETACERLLAAHPGAGSPKVEPINGTQAPVVQAIVVPEPAPVDNTPAPVIGTGSVCIIGAARSQTDYDDAVALGFAPKQSLYTRGTRVNETGVENARRSREEWANMPLVTDACADVVRRVEAEQRNDSDPVALSTLRYDNEGRLVLAGGRRIMLTERALSGIANRMPVVDLEHHAERGSVGGAGYLARIKPTLRAINLNHHARDLGEYEARRAAAEQGFTPTTTVLRTRRNGDDREVFAAVSAKYASFDTDKIAQALALAAPGDARGTVAYDGQRAKFELVYHSDVDAREYVAGEFFKAAVRVRTDDTGGGGIRVSAALFQNLCLNLIIIDTATQQIANLRHIGSVEKLAAAFRVAFDQAMKAIGPFITRWGMAAKEDVLARAITTEQITDAVPFEVALPGFFNGLIERDLVPVAMHGRKRTEVVADFVRMYAADESGARRDDGTITRAAVVNAITRYAHEVESDPFAGAEMEEAAGRLVAGKGSDKPLPCIPFE